MIKSYRQRPKIFQAVRWEGNNYNDIIKLQEGSTADTVRVRGPNVEIQAPGPGRIYVVQPGDFVIKQAGGDLIACDPHVFETLYEEVTG